MLRMIPKKRPLAATLAGALSVALHLGAARGAFADEACPPPPTAAALDPDDPWLDVDELHPQPEHGGAASGLLELNPRLGSLRFSKRLTQIPGGEAFEDHPGLNVAITIHASAAYSEAGPLGPHVRLGLDDGLAAAGGNFVHRAADGDRTYMPVGDRWFPDPSAGRAGESTLIRPVGASLALEDELGSRQLFAATSRGYRLWRMESSPLHQGGAREFADISRDEAGNVVAVTNHRGLSVSFALVAGRAVAMTDWAGRTFRFEYYPDGHLWKIISPGHHANTELVDTLSWSGGRLVGWVDADGVDRRALASASVSSLSWTAGSASSTAAVRYETEGCVARTIIDLPWGRSGVEWAFSVSTGKLLSYRDEAGKIQRNVYGDPARPGRVTETHDDSLGIGTRFLFAADAPWLPEQVIELPSGRIQWRVLSWNAAGNRPAQVATPLETTTYLYDLHNRVTRETSDAGMDHQIAFTAVAQGTLREERLNGGPPSTETYNAQHLRVEASLANGKVARWTRNAQGHLLGSTGFDGVIWSYSGLNSFGLPAQASAAGLPAVSLGWDGAGALAGMSAGNWSWNQQVTASGQSLGTSESGSPDRSQETTIQRNSHGLVTGTGLNGDILQALTLLQIFEAF